MLKIQLTSELNLTYKNEIEYIVNLVFLNFLGLEIEISYEGHTRDYCIYLSNGKKNDIFQ